MFFFFFFFFFVFFSTLEINLQSLLAYVVSVRNLSSCHPGSSVGMFFFLWLLLRLFFIITGFKQFDYDETWCVSLCGSGGGSLSFWDLWVYNFHPIWENSGHYFQIFVSLHAFPFGDFNHMCIWWLKIVLQFTDALFFCFLSPLPVFHFDSF